MRALGTIGEGLIEIGLEPAPDRRTTLGFGGDAANTAVMAAMLGAPARLGGRVGDDGLGRRLVAFWESAGVDTAHVVTDGGGATGIYVNERGAEGLHRFDYHRRRSAGSRLEPGDLDEAFFADLGFLHLTGITLAVSRSSERTALEAIRRAAAGGATVSIAVNHRPSLRADPTPIVEAARAAGIVFLSEEEAEVIGVPDAPEVVLTRGRAGAGVRVGATWHEVAAPPVTVVDAAGAGDALAGAYLARRLAGLRPEDALRAGVVAASLSCSSRGCALSYPTSDELAAAL